MERLAYSLSLTTIHHSRTYAPAGCKKLQVGALICVSPGKPPPIPYVEFSSLNILHQVSMHGSVNPDLQCGPESRGNKTCPLNACCSAYGFCGLTKEFCEDAPVSVSPLSERQSLIRITINQNGESW